MGDTTDGSSNAAQRAQPDQSDDAQKGFFARLFEALSPNGEEDESAMDGQTATAVASQTLGLLNLRRMRVEDVMVPKADIYAVPVTISKDDLVQVFRETD